MTKSLSRQGIARGLILSVLVLSASACSSGNDGGGSTGNTTTPVPPVVVVRQEDQFGTQFGVAFRAALNGEPFTLNHRDLVPV